MTHLSTVHINCEAISKYVIVFRNQNKGLTFSFCGFSAVSLNTFVTMLVLLSHLKFVHAQQRNFIIAVNGLEFCTANITVWNFKIILKTQTCIMLLMLFWCKLASVCTHFIHMQKTGFLLLYFILDFHPNSTFGYYKLCSF